MKQCEANTMKIKKGFRKVRSMRIKKCYVNRLQYLHYTLNESFRLSNVVDKITIGTIHFGCTRS